MLSQLKSVIRTNYSQPADARRQVVAAVLGDAGLRALWEEELGRDARPHQGACASRWSSGLAAAGVRRRTSASSLRQQGMFSYSGPDAAQMQRLRNDFGVYGVDSGRICVAALNGRNIDAMFAPRSRRCSKLEQYEANPEGASQRFLGKRRPAPRRIMRFGHAACSGRGLWSCSISSTKRSAHC